MTFKTCPICGNELTWEKNVETYDDEGYPTDFGELTYTIVLHCPCGFQYACNEEKVGFIIDSRWRENFEELANRRVKNERT